MADKLGRGDVAHLAKMTRIRLSEAEAARALDDLNAIFEMIAQMQSADVEAVDSLAHLHGQKLRLRPDQAEAAGDREELLRAAPQTAGGYFLVPKVIE